MKIVIVNGTGFNKKTPFEIMVQQTAATYNKKVIILSTTDYVKSLAQSIGWIGERTEKDLLFLKNFKNALAQWNDSPYQTIKSTIDHFIESTDIDLIFVDSRELDEIKRLAKEYKALTIFVQDDSTTSIDNNIQDYSYDILIDTSRGLEELQQEATIFVKTFLLEK